MSAKFDYILKIKILDAGNQFLKDKYQEIENKLQIHAGDVGFDLFQPQDLEVGQGYSIKNGLGIACELIRREYDTKTSHTDYPVPYMLVPRSSIIKTPLRLANSIGIIDSGYRGELMAFMDCHKPYEIKQGDRLFQLVLPNMQAITKIILTDELSDTSRGTGGFGSTGK